MSYPEIETEETNTRDQEARKPRTTTTPNHELPFFHALQSNAIVIDADFIGSAILLRTARLAEYLTNHDEDFTEIASRVQIDLISPFGNKARIQALTEIFVQELGYRRTIENTYQNSERGRLFVSPHMVKVGTGRADFPASMVEIFGTQGSQGRFSVVVHSITVNGEVALAESIMERLLEKGFVKSMGSLTIVSMVENRLVRKTGIIDATRLGLDVFYPQLPCSIAEYTKAYLESDAPVLFMAGEPRTGKSTLIRTIIHLSELPATITSDSDAVVAGGLLTPDDDERSEVGLHLSVMEDCDNLVRSRKDMNDYMSKQLNETEGVAQSRAKRMITTNLTDLKNIDPALLGPGRTFDILVFKPYTYEQAVRIAETVGRDPSVFKKGETYTLGEVMKMNVESGSSYFSFKGNIARPAGFGTY